MKIAQPKSKFERLAAFLESSDIDAAAVADQVQRFTERLNSLSPYGRKLLAQIAELAYHGRGQQRKADVAYLPELYESSGLGVETMYPLLEELQNARFIHVEDSYPFEDVKIESDRPGVNLLRAIARCCEQDKVPLSPVLVEGRFELLQ